MKPTVPVKEAGCRMEPPVSEPRAACTTWAATLAAAPPEDPPGTRFSSSGLRTGPWKLVSLLEPMANSSQLVRPRITASAASSRSTTVALYRLVKPSSMREEALTRWSL